MYLISMRARTCGRPTAPADDAESPPRSRTDAHVDADVGFLEAGGGSPPRVRRHRVGTQLVFGEGDDVANGGIAADEHDQSVEAKRDAAMRGGAPKPSAVMRKPNCSSICSSVMPIWRRMRRCSSGCGCGSCRHPSRSHP